MSCQTSIAVVYLCRAQESKDAFHRFVNSYRRHPASAAHELIIAFKGFEGPSQLLAAQAIFADVPYTSIEIDDSGFDIGAYLKVSQRIDHEYVCFFNTFSELISDGWLELMYRQASDPTVGIVGAMGSYEGLRSSFALINKVIWLTNTIHIDYDENFHDHFEFVIDQHCQAWRDKQVRHAHLFRKLGDYRWVRNQLSLMRRRWRSRFGRYWRSLIRQSDFMARIRQFPGFPNAHIRSNGFMLARARLLEEVPTIAEKLDACEFESGQGSLTNRLRRQGLSAVVVGRDGMGYDVADWAHSGTFRLGNQSNLILSDNRSREFTEMTPGVAATHTRMTWGDYLEPAPASFPHIGIRFPINPQLVDPAKSKLRSTLKDRSLANTWPPKLRKPTLKTLYQRHVGKSSDKWGSYLDAYDRLFADLRDQPITMLEIGIQNGGSLEIWSRYFPRAETFVGCDIDPLCGKLRYDDQRIHVVVGDATSNLVADEIRSICPQYDLMIDDGSHTASDIVAAFVRYFPALKPGGIFVVEDTHCMYFDSHQGGLLKPTTAHEFFKLFVDLVNCEHWQKDHPINPLFQQFFGPDHVPRFLEQGWIDGVEFQNSLVIIRKAVTPTNAKLGKRWIVGDEATVAPANLVVRQLIERGRLNAA